MKRRAQERHGAGYVVPRPQKNGTTRYQARWPEGGRWPALTFDTEDEAYAFLDERAAGHTAPADLTVDGLICEMLERWTHLSERTISTYDGRRKTMISPRIGDRRVIELKTLDIQRWIDGLRRDDYAPSTIHAAVAVLHSAFRDAAVLGVIDRNIAQGIRRPGIEDIRRVQWTREEARRFIEVIRDDELYGAMYYVAIATGMRPGELRALGWEDVHLDTGTIVVRRTMTKDRHNKEIIGVHTKTRKIRAVAITFAVVERLRWHAAQQKMRRQRCAGWHDLDLAFDRGDGYWFAQSSWRTAHIHFCAQAEVRFCRAHDLRHTSASLELEAGTHPKVVADRLGHSRVEMTLNRYSHVNADLQRAAADALGARLFDPAETRYPVSQGRLHRTRKAPKVTRHTRKRTRKANE